MKKHLKIIIFVTLGLVPIFMLSLIAWIFSPIIPEGSEILHTKVIIEKKPNEDITAQILKREKVEGIPPKNYAYSSVVSLYAFLKIVERM